MLLTEVIDFNIDVSKMTTDKVSLSTDTSCGDYAVPLAPAHYSDTDSDLERTEDYVFLQVE